MQKFSGSNNVDTVLMTAPADGEYETKIQGALHLTVAGDSPRGRILLKQAGGAYIASSSALGLRYEYRADHSARFYLRAGDQIVYSIDQTTGADFWEFSASVFLLDSLV